MVRYSDFLKNKHVWPGGRVRAKPLMKRMQTNLWHTTNHGLLTYTGWYHQCSRMYHLKAPYAICSWFNHPEFKVYPNSKVFTQIWYDMIIAHFFDHLQTWSRSAVNKQKPEKHVCSCQVSYWWSQKKHICNIFHWSLLQSKYSNPEKLFHESKEVESSWALLLTLTAGDEIYGVLRLFYGYFN